LHHFVYRIAVGRISYNIAPSEEVLAIRYNPETKQRSLDRLRWGLVPYWANDEKIGFKTINARAVTVDTAPSFRSAFKKRRCLIPADGFYEWKKVIGGKIPYSIGMKDDNPLFSQAYGRVGRIRRLTNGCGRARLLLASRMSWSLESILGCLSFSHQISTIGGCSERRGRRFYGRFRPKK
jgi:SOS response associated peptidase (SRAP)